MPGPTPLRVVDAVDPLLLGVLPQAANDTTTAAARKLQVTLCALFMGIPLLKMNGASPGQAVLPTLLAKQIDETEGYTDSSLVGLRTFPSQSAAWDDGLWPANSDPHHHDRPLR